MIYTQNRDRVDIRANGTICPIPNCGAVAVAYRLAGSSSDVVTRHGGSCDFTCPQCGFEFTASGHDLLFCSVPREWLLSEVCHA